MGCHRPLGCPFCYSLETVESDRKGWHKCKKCGTRYPEKEFD